MQGGMEWGMGKVLFGKIGNICMLDMRDVTGVEKSDIHGCLVCFWRKLCLKR